MVACIKIPVDKLVAERRCPLLRSNTFTQELFIAIPVRNYDRKRYIGMFLYMRTANRAMSSFTFTWCHLANDRESSFTNKNYNY